MIKDEQQRVIQIGGRTFQLKFWTEWDGYMTLHYAEVDELIPGKTIFGKPCLRSREIDRCWGAVDRVDWCRQRIKNLFKREQAIKADMEKIFNFCQKTT